MYLLKINLYTATVVDEELFNYVVHTDDEVGWKKIENNMKNKNEKLEQINWWNFLFIYYKWNFFFFHSPLMNTYQTSSSAMINAWSYVRMPEK